MHTSYGVFYNETIASYVLGVVPWEPEHFRAMPQSFDGGGLLVCLTLLLVHYFLTLISSSFCHIKRGFDQRRVHTTNASGKKMRVVLSPPRFSSTSRRLLVSTALLVTTRRLFAEGM